MQGVYHYLSTFNSSDLNKHQLVLMKSLGCHSSQVAPDSRWKVSTFDKGVFRPFLGVFRLKLWLKIKPEIENDRITISTKIELMMR